MNCPDEKNAEAHVLMIAKGIHVTHKKQNASR
jgi:hypothetical protein